MLTEVVGVDGCRLGWCVVTLRIRNKIVIGSCTHVVRSFEQVLSATEGAKAIAVDMPIGLPSSEGFPRDCDTVARKLLQHRASCVFPCPPRNVVSECAGVAYKEACALAKSKMGRGISIQTHCILPKTKELDACLTPSLQDKVFEVHPEVCFWAINGRSNLGYPKKGNKGQGFEERRSLLSHVISSQVVNGLLQDFPRHGASRDDILDALVAAYTAKCYVHRDIERIPKTPITDDRGLRMEMSFPV